MFFGKVLVRCVTYSSISLSGVQLPSPPPSYANDSPGLCLVLSKAAQMAHTEHLTSSLLWCRIWSHMSVCLGWDKKACCYDPFFFTNPSSFPKPFHGSCCPPLIDSFLFSHYKLQSLKNVYKLIQAVMSPVCNVFNIPSMEWKLQVESTKTKGWKHI